MTQQVERAALVLLMRLGRAYYGLDTRQVVDVVPAVEVQELPDSRDEVAGVLRYHGALVPVVDLCRWKLGRDCRSRLGTRIVLVQHPAGQPSAGLLGLRAEGVAATVTAKPAGSAAGTQLGGTCLSSTVHGSPVIVAMLDLDGLPLLAAASGK